MAVVGIRFMNSLPRALEDYDDFRVLGRDLSEHSGFTLTCVVKNEMFPRNSCRRRQSF